MRQSYLTNKDGIGAVIQIMGGQSGVVEFPRIRPGLRMTLEEVLLKVEFSKKKNTVSDLHEATNTFQNLVTLAK